MTNRRAVLIPGRGYDTRAPLFAYLEEVLLRAGFDVHPVSWQAQPPESSPAQTIGWVTGQVTPALAQRTDLLVGKSLGTLAAPLAADRGLPAVWLTPLLTRAEVVAALERAEAPFLLAGGTADPLWDGAVARRLTPHLLEIPDADHSMMLPGPLAASAAVLGRVCTAVEEFVQIS
jgi:pimeloyl-ACP methyl ester carboxylesterase